MGDVLYRQSLSITASKAPSVTGAPITEKDFEVGPNEVLELSDMSEDVGARFEIAAGQDNLALGMGTVALAKVLIFKAAADLLVKLTNGAGTSQNIKFKGGRTTILHAEFTGITISNEDDDNAVNGKFFFAGD